MSEEACPLNEGICPFCGSRLVESATADIGPFVFHEWKCTNSVCRLSHSDGDSLLNPLIANDSKSFDFEQYKKFRKRCKKRSKR